MNRVSAGFLGGRDDAVDVEIALAHGRRPDVHGLVGETHVQRGAVGVAVDRDVRDAEVAAGADHTDGDLTAVGDQYLVDAQGLAHARVPLG
jgi:hypothetical protein